MRTGVPAAALFFIAGAACQVASQPRTGADTDSEGAFLAATILYIMCVPDHGYPPALRSARQCLHCFTAASAASATFTIAPLPRLACCMSSLHARSGSSIFIGAAFLSVLGAHGEAKLLRIGGRLPGIGALADRVRQERHSNRAAGVAVPLITPRQLLPLPLCVSMRIPALQPACSS